MVQSFAQTVPRVPNRLCALGMIYAYSTLIADLKLTDLIGQGRNDRRLQLQPEQREKNAGVCQDPC
jgi:hypothetical protein